MFYILSNRLKEMITFRYIQTRIKVLGVMLRFRSTYSFPQVIAFSLLLIILGFVSSTSFQVFEISREQATELLKETLSNYISLLGIGLAILAVVLAIIQLAYKRLNIVKLVIDHTYFAPLVYFGLTHIAVCAFNFLYFSDPHSFWNDQYFIRIAVIEGYIFLLFIAFVGIVFFRTFKYIDFSKITDLYLANAKKLIVNEERTSSTMDLAENLQSISTELKSEK